MKIQITIKETDRGIDVHFDPPMEPIQEKIRLKIALEPVEQYAAVIATTIKKMSVKLDSYDPKKIKLLGEL
jgi:hypothetical protein